MFVVLKPGFIFVRTVFVQNGKWSPFLKLIPRPRQMPEDVTNISEAAEQTFASARSFGVIS